MTTARVPAVERILLALALMPVAAVVHAQGEPNEAIVTTDDSASSVLMPGESWDPSSTPPGLGSHAPSLASEEHAGAWEASSGYSAAVCTDPGWPSPSPCQGQDGRCGASGCHSQGLGDPPGLFQWFGHNKHACWSVRSDALLLWRNAPSSRPIYSNVVPDTDQLGSTALNANDLNSDVLAAPRLSLLRTDCDGHVLETTYLYAGNFYSERSLPFSPDGYATSPPGIYGNVWGPPDTSLDSARAVLIGQLQSLEFNSRHCIWGGMSQFLIGARWLQWNETLQMKDTFAYAEPEPIAGRDFYETRCFNNLWGGQIGLDTLLLGRVGMARVEGLVKAGAYYNAAGQASTFSYALTDGDTFSNQARAGGPAACSFVGEVGMTAVLPITCNCDFRCGYTGLWLANIAQPTKQLSDQQINQFDSVASLDTSGSVLLQGLTLGLEGRW